MAIPFIVCNFILVLSLVISVALSAIMPKMLMGLLVFEWLSVVLAGWLVNIAISEIYNLLIPKISSKLNIEQKNWIFVSAALCALGLMYLKERTSVDEIVNFILYSQQALSLQFLIIVFCAADVWQRIDEENIFNKLLFSFLGGCCLLYFFIASSLFVLSTYVDATQFGFAQFAAGWVAALVSRLINFFIRSGTLENEAANKMFDGFWEGSLSIIVAVMVCYVYFKLNGVSSILFSMAIGVMSAIISHIIPASFENN